ncbi:chromosome segregation protein SMC [Candidatus Poribacteria bacterium]|nr:chromosome segregation protein SMC [Candidatus Poribacteria bacterium]
MFQKISLTNYRTHKFTEIELHPVTLLIGNNNSGKSNFLAGIRHFSQLVARARPNYPSSEDVQEEDVVEPSRKQQLWPSDLFPHRYRLASDKEPMAFCCTWKHTLGEVEYQIEFYEERKFNEHVACRERIKIREMPEDKWKTEECGWNEPINKLILRTRVEESKALDDKEKQICRLFFRDMAQAFAYHFQPSYLKGQAKCDWPKVNPNNLRIPSQLGYEGGNLQEILIQIREKDERIFNRFIASMRRFESSFHGIRWDSRREQIIWEFDIGRGRPGRLEEFPPEVVSDGLMKGAAISLLTSIYNPPSLILLEEIENGINPGNIKEFIGWLWKAAGLSDSSERGYATQFILTTHSPSVLREFSEHLDCVYTFHLNKHNLESKVRNLIDVLNLFIDVGTIEAEIDQQDGRIKILPYKLSELWFSGTIG